MRRTLVSLSMLAVSAIARAQQLEAPGVERADLVDSYYRSKGFVPTELTARASPQRWSGPHVVQGWTVWIDEDLRADPVLRQKVITRLTAKLQEARSALPAAAYERIRQDTGFWLEKENPHWPCAVYHPSADWLQQNGQDPAKAKHIEITNAANFLAWTTDQPAMVIHELTHAYHDKVVRDGWANKEVLDAYDQAVASRRYEQVAHVRGGPQRAYALTNAMEYFAELTEAYFWRNDFYPFVRTDIPGHDPGIYRLLPLVWAEAGRVPGLSR